MWVGSCPVSRTSSTSGREVSGTARTSGATAICCRERARKRRLRRAISVKTAAAAMAATAASKEMSCVGAVGGGRGTDSSLAATGSADTSVENGLSFPVALTAVTMK